MFVNASKNKENYEEKRLKKASSLEEEDVFKGREFGKELTNKADSTTDEENNEKGSIFTNESAYESNIPQFSGKTHKMSENGTEIPLIKTKSLKVNEYFENMMVLMKINEIMNSNKNLRTIYLHFALNLICRLKF